MDVKRYFPEYVKPNGKFFMMYRGSGMFKTPIRAGNYITMPWRYAPNVYYTKDTPVEQRKPNMEGYIVMMDPMSAPPYRRITKEKVSDEVFAKYCDTLNFYRNGGKTIYGTPGLDPKELDGGQRGLKEPFICKNGKFWLRTRAFFKFNDGTVWAERVDET